MIVPGADSCIVTHFHRCPVALIAIVLLLATFVFAIIVMRNFGRGLKNTSAF